MCLFVFTINHHDSHLDSTSTSMMCTCVFCFAVFARFMETADFAFLYIRHLHIVQMYWHEPSCESYRLSAYGEDLRWKIIWQKVALGYSDVVIAQNQNINKSTVYRILQFYNTETVSKHQYPKDKSTRKLTDLSQLCSILQFLSPHTQILCIF